MGNGPQPVFFVLENIFEKEKKSFDKNSRSLPEAQTKKGLSSQNTTTQENIAITPHSMGHFFCVRFPQRHCPCLL
jgi:hypothetical protein